jgi:hypothetical protein
MYRELAILPGAAPTEFVYAPKNRAAAQRWLLLCVFAPVAFAVVEVVCMRWLDWDLAKGALPATLVTAGMLAVAARGMTRRQVTRFRIDGHELELWAPAGAAGAWGASAARGPVRMALGDLQDVALDTESIERVIDGPSAIPAMRFADARVAPPLDVARIVLSFRDGNSMPLTAERLSHLETTDVYGKMRMFLRKNGWQPADERDAEA